MRTARVIAMVVCLAVVLALASLQAGSGATAVPPPPSSASERMIVLLERPGALAAGSGDVRPRGPGAVARARRELRAQQQDVRSSVRARGVHLVVHRSWTGLVNGFAATVASGDVAVLRRTPGVRRVVPDEPVRLDTDISVPQVGAPEVWTKRSPKSASTRGQGTVIAVVDSGIDYTSPSLGDGFGEGHKVVAGHDFVNDDADPMDDNGHGTHVAGIAAGEGEITGVAPAATLTAYKVVDASGGGYGSDVLAGLEAAVDPANPHRADVVNMSLSMPGDGTDPVGEAATVATQNGVVVVASAGNGGPAPNTLGSPAVADGVLSVGASASGVSVPALTMTAPERLPLQTVRAGISANPPKQPMGGTVVDVGRGTPEEVAEAGDLSGKVVAVQGRITEPVEYTSPRQIDFARSIEDTGAIGLVYYRAGSGGPMFSQQPRKEEVPGEVEWPLAASGDTFRMDRLIVLGLRELEWEQIATRLAHGPVRLQISGRDVTDRIASFSSRGPTGDYALGPDLVAPGLEILSAWPTKQWEPGVFRLSGTSMSAPHVAGAAALLRQLDPQAGPDRIAGRLTGSAHLVDDAGPAVQGAGRLDVAAASEQTVTAAPTSLSFGLADTTAQQLRAKKRVTVRNDGPAAVTLALRARPSEGSVGRASVKPRRVTIPPGGAAGVSVTVAGATPDTRSELSGWLEAVPAGSARPAVRVPYLLAVVPVIVQASPDPGVGGTTLFIGTPADLTAPPVVTVRAPKGPARTVDAVHDHGTWWRADYRSDVPGEHVATVRAATALGPTTTGTGLFEVLPADTPGVGEWETVGPNSQAGSIAESSADPDTMVLDQPGKLSPWFSIDDGETWREVPAWPVADGVGTTVIDPTNPRQMWRTVTGAVGTALYDPTYQGKILRSTDGGRSWHPLAAPDVAYTDLVTDSQGRVLVAVAAGSLQVSRDDGESWTAYPNPAGTHVDDIAFSAADLFLASERQVWKFGGLAAGDPATAQVVYTDDDLMRGMVADDDMVAVLTGTNAVEVSTDGGGSWELRYQGPRYGPWDLLLAGDDLIVTTYYGYGLIGSDHGASWTKSPYPVRGPIPVDATYRDGTLLWAEENAGLVVGDPETGDFQDRIGVQGMTVSDLTITPGNELLATTRSGLYDTDVPTGEVTAQTREWGLSGGEGWHGKGVSLIDDAPSDGSVLWRVDTGSFSGFRVLRSTDGGGTWHKRGGTSSAAHALAIDAHHPNTVAVSFSNLEGAGVYLTRDGGASWRKMFHGQPFAALAPDPDVPGRLWLGGSRGLYVSNDFGVTLRRVHPGPVTALDATADRLVTAGDQIAVSTDDGASFREFFDGDLPTYFSGLVTSPTHPHVMFAGTRRHIANGLVKNGRGVLMSTNGGRTWTNVSAGLQNVSIESLTMTEDGRWLFAGTTDGGVHRLSVAR